MIRVASYNIRKALGTDRRRSPDRIIHVLNEIDADIVALQEADRRFGARQSVLPLALLHEHSDLRPVTFGIRDGGLGWHGNAILVRKAATIDHCEPVHLPALEPRGAVIADVTVGGVSLRIAGMHLDLSGLWRRRQARALIHHLDLLTDKRPSVLMGDTNEWSRAGGCLRDFAKCYNFAQTGRSFHARRPVAALDRIMASEGLRIESAGVHATPTSRKASDHLPVWAEIENGERS